MKPNNERIRELQALMSANSRRNNEIFQKTDHLDQHILFDNIRIKDEIGRLSSAKNMDVSALA